MKAEPKNESNRDGEDKNRKKTRRDELKERAKRSAELLGERYPSSSVKKS